MRRFVTQLTCLVVLAALCASGAARAPSIGLVGQDPAPVPRVEPAATPAPRVDEQEAAYQALTTQYGAAEKAYFVALDAARKAGQTPAQSGLAHPVAEYYPRFDTLAKNGNGHALLWTALRVEALHPAQSKAENAKATLAQLNQVLELHAREPWIKELAVALSALYVVCPANEVDALVEQLVSKSPDKEIAAEALYRAAAAWKRSKAEGANDRAKGFFDRLTKDYAATAFGRRHSGEGSPEIGLAQGKVAPDFTAKDADGVEFKLSDYRGKVVVLDFWGFW